MKKTLTLLLLALFSCKTDSSEVTTLTSPVILIGKTPSSITVVDGNGVVMTFLDSAFAKNVSNSREVGDTLK